MICVVVSEAGWVERVCLWINQGGIAVMSLMAIVVLWRWTPMTLRVVRSPELRRDRRWLGASLSIIGIALLAVMVGVLLLMVGPTPRPPGSCWILIGLTGFFAPLRAIAAGLPPALPWPVWPWLTEPRLEIVSSCLMVGMGVLSLV